MPAANAKVPHPAAVPKNDQQLRKYAGAEMPDGQTFDEVCEAVLHGEFRHVLFILGSSISCTAESGCANVRKFRLVLFQPHLSCLPHQTFNQRRVAACCPGGQLSSAGGLWAALGALIVGAIRNGQERLRLLGLAPLLIKADQKRGGLFQIRCIGRLF